MNAKALKDLMTRNGRTDAVDFRIKAKGKSSADMYFYDVIGMWGISAQMVADALKNIGSVKTLNVNISSDGGDVFEGRAIYSQLMKYKTQNSAEIKVYVDGLAASIASLLAMSGDEIHMPQGSFMMIHNAWGFAIGDAEEMRKTADLLDTLTNSIIDTYVSRTGGDRKEITQMVSDETWMDAQKCFDEGFCTHIDEALQVAASVKNPEVFGNLPRELNPKMVELRALRMKAKAFLR